MHEAYRSNRVPDELLAGLNLEQEAAVAHRGTPLLVVAGPGSGKTRVLTHRIAGLVREGADPSRILAVTFTNKAAAEMRHRLATLLSEAEVPRSVSTFHSFCVRTLRANAAEVGIPRSFSVLDASDAERLMASTMSTPDRKEARWLLSKVSFAKNALRTPEELAASSSKADREAAAHWVPYQRRLTEMGALDFDDLLLYTRLLLTTPAAVQVQDRFSSILVDEWQDTNAVQYDIVKLLAGNDRASRDVCVVGDAEQAIYGWRGSTPEVVDRFVEDFAPCTVIELGLNYRSTPQIVAVASQIAAAAQTRHKVHLRTENPAGAPVRVLECDDPDHEVETVVAELRRASGTRAVLVRTNAQTRGFELALNAAGIAHQLVGTTRFTDRAEVRDALAYLRLVANPADEIAFTRAASTPRRKFGDVALAAFFDACRTAATLPGNALADPTFLATLPKRVATPATAFAVDLDTVRTAAHLGPAAAVRATLTLGLRAFHASDPERVQNLDELIVYAESFERERIGSDPSLTGPELLEAFLEAAALASSTDVDERSPVSVITAHASKGREFDHVWVVGTEEDVFPHLMAADRDGVEEERRLFFVAVSRARDSLTISHRRRHFLAGEWRDAAPSRFLEPIEHLTNQIRPGSPRRPTASRRPQYGWGTRPAPRPTSRITPSTVSVPLPASSRPSGPRLTPSEAQPGTKVVHQVFGPGTVRSLTGTMAVIEFGSKTRTLDLDFAPLTLE